MTRVSIDVDVEMFQVWDELSEREKHQWTQDSIKNGYGVPPVPAEAEKLLDLALAGDAVAVLAIVNWLRNNGYTVEPA